MTELALSFRIGRSSVGAADPVIIHQLFSNGIRSGEEKLMLAVLQDAVECFQENALSEQPWEKKLFQEAEDWILAKNADWLFSFKNICETLQLNPGYIRRGLLVWKHAKRKSDSAAAKVEITT
jgi:hypothetical protein